jgi:flavin reductase (DIM6/NTAB) family NADH-FMN oxidoreductase RutF
MRKKSMAKIKYGPSTLVVPMPAFLIGANVLGKANFMTAAWGSVVCSNPPMIAISLQPRRYTYKGIQENNTFSVNIPSEDLVSKVDYCGLVSGRKSNKVDICKFHVFYGQLETAPMIEQCPINHECKVFQTIELGSHILVIGESIQTYLSEACFKGSKLDLDHIKSFMYVPGNPSHYLSFGEDIGTAFNIGKDLLPVKA